MKITKNFKKYIQKTLSMVMYMQEKYYNFKNYVWHIGQQTFIARG